MSYLSEMICGFLQQHLTPLPGTHTSMPKKVQNPMFLIKICNVKASTIYVAFASCLGTELLLVIT